MLPEEWKHIDHFSIKEVIEANGTPEGIELKAMRKLDSMRKALGRRIHFVRNGLNSGEHSAPLHRMGRAFDFYLNPKDGDVDVYQVVLCAIASGFRGFGVYWNGNVFSFHVDTRKKVSFWRAVPNCKQDGKRWEYKKFITNNTFTEV